MTISKIQLSFMECETDISDFGIGRWFSLDTVVAVSFAIQYLEKMAMKKVLFLTNPIGRIGFMTWRKGIVANFIKPTRLNLKPEAAASITVGHKRHIFSPAQCV